MGTNFPPGSIVTKAMLDDARVIQQQLIDDTDSEWRCCACGQVTERKGRRYKCPCDRKFFSEA